MNPQISLKIPNIHDNKKEINSKMYFKDWRNGLRSPPTYRIGNRSIRFQVHFAWILASFCLLFMFFFYFHPGGSKSSYSSWNSISFNAIPSYYNHTYPLTSPSVSNGAKIFRIGIIADLDTNSKLADSNTWRSYYKKGYLTYNDVTNKVSIRWDDVEPIELSSSFSLKGIISIIYFIISYSSDIYLFLGRGMELSELVVFNGKLLTFDDRTGLIYELENNKLIPWVLLIDGDGQTTKGFKSEWATVKDQTLYVGSMGKEWTSSSGDFENVNPMFVKAVNTHGEVRHQNWLNNYKAIRSSIGISWPGYMIHESGVWSSEKRRWFFLPRRCSKERYNETKDERMGCNVLISADEDFSNVKVTKIGEIQDQQPTHGYSSFKFIPGSNDNIIVALKTEELNGKTSTFISVFTIDGKNVIPEEKIETHYKYEGIEFI